MVKYGSLKQIKLNSEVQQIANNYVFFSVRNAGVYWKKLEIKKCDVSTQQSLKPKKNYLNADKQQCNN